MLRAALCRCPRHADAHESSAYHWSRAALGLVTPRATPTHVNARGMRRDRQTHVGAAGGADTDCTVEQCLRAALAVLTPTPNHGRHHVTIAARENARSAPAPEPAPRRRAPTKARQPAAAGEPRGSSTPSVVLARRSLGCWADQHASVSCAALAHTGNGREPRGLVRGDHRGLHTRPRPACNGSNRPLSQLANVA
jgi:hypothetical protein